MLGERSSTVDIHSLDMAVNFSESTKQPRLLQLPARSPGLHVPPPIAVFFIYIVNWTVERTTWAART